MAIAAHSVVGKQLPTETAFSSRERPSCRSVLDEHPRRPPTFTGAATSFTGPPGPTYTIDGAGDYGPVGAGATVDCHEGDGRLLPLTRRAAGGPLGRDFRRR